jgi:multidrug efflux pump subunit AcrB
MWITDFSVKNSQFTFVVFLAVMALGIGAMLQMPRAEDPKFDPPGFSVVMVWPGAGPAEIEDKITNKLEARIGALADIDRMSSYSANGTMVLIVEFKHGSSSEQKYEEVIREINALRPELPSNLYRTQVQKFSSSDVNIIQAALISETASWDQLRTAAEELESSFEKLEGVKGADTWGFPRREVRVNLNLAKMSALHIGADRVIGALQSENVAIPGGAVHIGDRQFFVETSGDYTDIDEIRNTIIMAQAGSILYLKDVAAVDFAYEDPRHITEFNGHRCVFVTAKMKNNQNINTVGDAIRSAMEKFRQGLSRQMDLQVVFDQEASVKKRLTRFAKDFSIAVFLVLLTLLPLGWRAALVVMISIPLSVAIGLFALDQLGYSLNQLSIVGLIISLGILVDDSIVVVENIERWLRDGHPRRLAAIQATRQIGLAVVGCTATLILAFLPLLFLPEASGDFIRSMPMAVVATVSASLLVSLTIVPFLGSRLLAENHHPEGNRFLRGLKWVIARTYAPLLHRGLRYPRATLLLAAAIFFGAIALASRAGFALFPSSERPMFYIDIETEPGTNLHKTHTVVNQVDSVLLTLLDTEKKRYPGRGAPARIISFASNTGKGNPRIYYNLIPRQESPEHGQVFVQLQERTPPPLKVALIDTLRSRFSLIAGARIYVKNFEQGPPIEAPVDVRLFGENLDTLRMISGQVEDRLKSMEGTIYTDNPISAIKTDILVKINKEKAAKLGIPVVEIDKMVRLALAGWSIGSYSDNVGKEYNINLTLSRPGVYPDLSVLNNLYINNIPGGAVPLNQVATLEFKRSPNTITHYDKDRYNSVGCFVESGYLASDINRALADTLKQMNFPKGYWYVQAGEVESSQRSFGGMGTTILIAVFGLMAVLILEFGTFRSTLVVLSVIPLGIIGAVMMLLATGYPFSFTVVVGLIALMGIEVKNSILLVDFTNQLRESGKNLDDAIQEAGEIRFIPILLTSLTAIGGMIPLALEANPLYSPLAYILIGGLISSTLLARIVTPVLYKLLAPGLGAQSAEATKSER